MSNTRVPSGSSTPIAASPSPSLDPGRSELNALTQSPAVVERRVQVAGDGATRPPRGTAPTALSSIAFAGRERIQSSLVTIGSNLEDNWRLFGTIERAIESVELEVIKASEANSRLLESISSALNSETELVSKRNYLDGLSQEVFDLILGHVSLNDLTRLQLTSKYTGQRALEEFRRKSAEALALPGFGSASLDAPATHRYGSLDAFMGAANPPFPRVIDAFVSAVDSALLKSQALPASVVLPDKPRKFLAPGEAPRWSAAEYAVTHIVGSLNLRNIALVLGAGSRLRDYLIPVRRSLGDAVAAIDKLPPSRMTRPLAAAIISAKHIDIALQNMSRNTLTRVLPTLDGPIEKLGETLPEAANWLRHYAALCSDEAEPIKAWLEKSEGLSQEADSCWLRIVDIPRNMDSSACHDHFRAVHTLACQFDAAVVNDFFETDPRRVQQVFNLSFAVRPDRDRAAINAGHLDKVLDIVTRTSTKPEHLPMFLHGFERMVQASRIDSHLDVVRRGIDWMCAVEHSTDADWSRILEMTTSFMASPFLHDTRPDLSSAESDICATLWLALAEKAPSLVVHGALEAGENGLYGGDRRTGRQIMNEFMSNCSLDLVIRWRDLQAEALRNPA